MNVLIDNFWILILQIPFIIFLMYKLITSIKIEDNQKQRRKQIEEELIMKIKMDFDWQERQERIKKLQTKKREEGDVID